MIFHDKLKTRIIFKGTLVTISTFRIGTSEEGGIIGIDMPVLRTYIYNEDSKENLLIPFIPASSIKGVLRSEYNRIINSTEEDKEKMQRSIKLLFGGKVKTYNSDKSTKEEEDFSALLKIRDSLPLDYHPITKEKISVRIERNSRTAVKGGLFHVEIVQPRTKFNFTAILDNIDLNDPSYTILKFVIKELALGRLPLGAGTSRGHGRVEIPNLQIEYYSKAQQLLGLSPPQILNLME